MRFVLTLHSHLPWVLHHGRWPHGSDWICEATLDTYLPLLALLDRAAAEGVPTPITLGVTPILAAQLAHPTLVEEVDAYFAHRLETIATAPDELRASGETDLLPVVEFWSHHVAALHRLWRSINGDILGALRRHAEAGRIELISSAATHGFLPLLGRDESIRLQLLAGRAEHLRHFGELPLGCWLPECAYRPAGPWQPWPTAPAAEDRSGIEAHLRYAGFRWFTVDAHLAEAGDAWEMYGGKAMRREAQAGARSPYRAYEVAPVPERGRPVHVVVRDPKTTAQVWSRHGGYPGDEWLHSLYQLLDTGGMVSPSTGSALLAASPPTTAVAMQAGSWGKDGDFSMWMSEEVAWTWERLWPLEERFWNAAPEALRHPAVVPVLEQAARELLLAQSSDWQFIISTGAAGDYATRRFTEHCDALESLLPALESGAGDLTGALAAAARLREIDGPFPDLVGAIAAASDVPPR